MMNWLIESSQRLLFTTAFLCVIALGTYGSSCNLGRNRSLLSSNNAGTDNLALTGELRVLTYNTYLLRREGLMSFYKERLRYLPSALSETGADIMLLQEVWDYEADDAKAHLIPELRKLGYPFAAFYKPSIGDKVHTPLGTGILIISRYEIGESNFEHWKNWTRKAETISKKGTLLAPIEVPGFGEIQFFSSHTSTKQKLGDGSYDTSHVEKRIEQIDQLLEFMKRSKRSTTKAQILGIDLNTHHLELANGKYVDNLAKDYSALAVGKGLSDTYDVKNFRQGFTWDTENFWVRSGLFPEVDPARLDYIFVSDDLLKMDCCRVVRSEIVLNSKRKIRSAYFGGLAKNFEAPLSDHYGIMATFKLKEVSAD